MKTVLLFFISLFPIYYLGAQTVTVSEPLNIRSDQAYELLGQMKDRFLLYRHKTNNTVEIQAYTNDMRQSWSKELDFEKKRMDVVGVIPDDDFFSIFYKFKRKGRVIVKVNKYDAGANLIDSTTVINLENQFNTPNITVIRSQDRSKVLLYSIERQTKIKVMSFDIVEMKLMWENEFAPDKMAFHADYQQMLVTNEGAMYYIMGKDNRKSSREDHLYEVYYANAGTRRGSISFIEISMKEMMTFDILFEYDDLNDNIVAAGLYSDKNRGKAVGHLFMKIPAANPSSYELSFHGFDDKFVSDYLGKAVKENRGIPETVVKEIILRRDGGIIMVAERNRLLERAMSTAARTGYLGEDGRSYIIDYHYEDMFIASIHPDGETHWREILPKRQYSQDDDAIYSSFFSLKTPSSLRFIFNDEIKYENTVSEYVVRGNGDFNRNSVMSTSNQKLQLRFRDGVQTGANELIIPSERRSRLKLVKIVY